MINLTSEINSMMLERDMKLKEVTAMIKDMLRSAYKRKFGTDENVKIKFYEDSKKNYFVEIYAKKEVVDEENYYNEVTQIPLDEALEFAGEDSGIAVGDELEISLDPKSFEYSAVQSAKQRGQAVSKEITDDKTYFKAKGMEFTLIKGELKKQGRNDDWFVDIGFGDENLAVFPLRGQSPRRHTSAVTRSASTSRRSTRVRTSRSGTPRQERSAEERRASRFIFHARARSS